MTTSPVSPRLTRSAGSGDFLQLSAQIKEAGLLDRRPLWYIGRGVVLATGFAVAFTLLFTLGSTWWQLAVAAAFGVLFTQAAFVAHDAAHQQIFSTGARNEWASRIIGDLVVGLSHGWWAKKHGKHHAHPNTIGKDGDIATGALVFDPEDVPARTGIVGWITRNQGSLFFPMLTLEGIALHRTSVQTVIDNPTLRHRRTEGALLAIRLIGFPALVFTALGFGMGVAFLAVQLAVFGVYMGASFAPNHKGMPLLAPRDTVDFLRRQVLTSRNIRGGRAMTWAMGGLNYQIEHHLFPRMPSGNLRRARPIVQEYCAQRQITYTETDLLTAYRIVIGYLNRVGLGHADPFECPLRAQLRPGSRGFRES